MSDNVRQDSLRNDGLRSNAMRSPEPTETSSEVREASDAHSDMGNTQSDTQAFAANEAEQPSPSLSLGQRLCQAREAKKMAIKDVSATTHVRKEYLQALDEGNYDILPENVYTRNFIRLYAQAVGLDEKDLLELYHQERFGSEHGQKPVRHDNSLGSAAHVQAGRSNANNANTANGAEKRTNSEKRTANNETSSMALSTLANARPRWDIAGMLPALLLAVVLVALGVWGFNTFWDAYSVQNVSAPAEDEGLAATPAGAPEASAPAANAVEGLPAVLDNPLNTVTANTPQLVLFSLASTPPGAEVSIDNYEFPTATPIVDAPITAGEGRTLRVSLEGYQTYEAPIDLSFDRRLRVELTPMDEALASSSLQDLDNPDQPALGNAAAATVAAAAAIAEDDAEALAEDSTEAADAIATGSIAISITEASWLEVYSSTARGQGSRLVYRIAQPGETFTFNLPVYIHVGNSSGVQIATADESGLIGPPGQVLGRAFAN